MCLQTEWLLNECLLYFCMVFNSYLVRRKANKWVNYTSDQSNTGGSRLTCDHPADHFPSYTD